VLDWRGWRSFLAPDKRRADADGRKGGAGEEGGAKAAEKRQLQGAELTSRQRATRHLIGQDAGCRRATAAGENRPGERHAEALSDHARRRQQARRCPTARRSPPPARGP
jgi:hypothetical protein